MMLAVCAAVYGVAAALSFGRFTDRAPLRSAAGHMLAHVMEFALFIDEPRLILKAQFDLMVANFQLLRQIALPCAMLAVPFVLLYPAMDRTFGDHVSNVLTLHIGQPLPAGAVAETEGVRIVRSHEVSWRIRRPAKPRTRLFGLHWTVWFGAVSLISGAALYGFPRATGNAQGVARRARNPI